VAERRSTVATVSTQRGDQSVTTKNSIAGQVTELAPLWKASTEAAEQWDRWYRNDLGPLDMPKLPRKVTADVKDLRDASSTGWAKMIADSMTQDFIVKGIRQKDNGEAAPAVRLWQQNGLDSRQKPVHDGVIRHGKAFNLVGAAVGRLDGLPTAFVRGKSALVADAYYRDDFDEWPECYLEGTRRVNSDGSREILWDFYDEYAHYWLRSEEDFSKMEYIAYEPHGMGVTPVVRAAGNIDLTGRVVGEIEPYITLFKRLNQSTMDRLVVQRFGAFVIRWIAGIEEPETDEQKRAAAIALSMTDLLMVTNPQSKIGSLPPTPLDGYIRSREADIRDLSAVSQTPSFHMLGLSDNVGADGLAAAEASHMRKTSLWKVSLGEFWEASMRLAGHAAGRPEVAEDFESRVQWVDTSSYSFQSFAQGLATLATGLGIPGEALWKMVPNFEQPDIEEAKRLRVKEQAEAQAQMQMEADITAQAQASARGNATQPR
jgi:hypothetical protein